MLLRDRLNMGMNTLIRPEVSVFHRSWPAFQVCGYTGLALAIVLAMTLVTYLGLSPVVMAVIIFAAVLTFFGLAMATKIITGEENLVYYHHEIAVMVMASALLSLLHQPVLSYLDVTILGIGMFLVCGRIGCLMVGCCHGRPSTWGVCYRAEHAAAGFTPYYVGVRLFPIQAIESLWVLCIVLIGIALALTGQPPGTALVWYVVTYDIGRFCFEFMRGDAERPYLWGFSEAQWISLGLVGIIVAAELSGALPFHLWHAGVMAGLVLAMIAVTVKRRLEKTSKNQLLHPRHVKEVAAAIEQVTIRAAEGNEIGRWTVLPKRNSNPVEVRLAATSLGIQISASQARRGTDCVYHYALSWRDGRMTEETARTLADLLLLLTHTSAANELVQGSQGVFHLTVYPPVQ